MLKAVVIFDSLIKLQAHFKIATNQSLNQSPHVSTWGLVSNWHRLLFTIFADAVNNNFDVTGGVSRR